jgi:hypothetical protein
MFSPPPTKNDVVRALLAIKDIERPYGDNEGDPINSPSVLPKLTPSQQELVEDAESILKEYVRQPGDEGSDPNRRSLTELNKAGFRSSLGPDQYEPDRLVGQVEVGDWSLDLSDISRQTDDE